MLSSVLNSKRAIQVNIQIIRIFSKLRQLLFDHKDLRLEIAEIKQIIDIIITKQNGHDKNIELLFTYIDQLRERTVSADPSERTALGYQLGKSKE